MEQERSWISLVGFCMFAVLAVSLAFAAIVAGASAALANERGDNASGDNFREVAPATPSPQAGDTFTGMITDSHCGARHARNSRFNAGECVRACFLRGASYILVDGDRRYTLVGGDEGLGKLAGQRANVTGTRQGDAILVASVSAVF